MSAVVEGRRKGLFRRGSAPADASVDAPIAPEKGKKSGKRRGKEKPIGLPQVNLLPAEISDAIKARKIVKAAIFVLVLVLGGLAGLWWMQGSAISQAQTTLRPSAPSVFAVKHSPASVPSPPWSWSREQKATNRPLSFELNPRR